MIRNKIYLASLLLAVSCGEAKLPPDQYPLSAPDVFARLQKADLADFKLASQCGLLIHAYPDPKTEKEMGWYIMNDGVEVLSFKATLLPISEAVTQVNISVSAASDGGEQYDGDYFTPRPAVQQPIRPAIREMIDSTLAGRKYEQERVDSQIEGSRENNGVCWVQRGGLESGSGAFSVKDKAADRRGQ
jgi:hypothetical protein